MPLAPTAKAARVRLLPIVLVPVLALLALVAWGFSSPVGSSPDDDFHLASIWCGAGEVAPKCEAGDRADQRSVPRDVAVTSVCFAYQQKESAACQGDAFGTSTGDRVSTPRGNFSGEYPPVFYFVMSAFVGPDVDVSVLLMRIANSILFVGMFTALWLLLPGSLRRAMIWAALACVVPLGLFLIPSTNPSSWALLSGSTLWVALLGYFRTTGRRRIALGALAALSALIGAGARADAAVYVVIAVVVVVALTFRRDRRYAVEALLPLALTVMAAIFYFSASQSSVVSSGFDGQRSELSLGNLIVANVILLPDLWAGFFGERHWGLGWLDTEMPPIVWVTSLLLFGGSILVGLSGRLPRKGLALAVAFAAFVLVPLVIIVQSRSLIGALLQPRYILPLAVILVGVAVLGADHSKLISRTHRVIFAVGLAAADAVALEFNIRRYVTGTDVVSVDLDAQREWWWPDLAATPMVVWVAGSLAFAGALAILIVLDGRSATAGIRGRGPTGSPPRRRTSPTSTRSMPGAPPSRR